MKAGLNLFKLFCKGSPSIHICQIVFDSEHRFQLIEFFLNRYIRKTGHAPGGYVFDNSTSF